MDNVRALPCSAYLLCPFPVFRALVERVRLNSPHLCPIISCVTRTGINFLPLYTFTEESIAEGGIDELLDHIAVGVVRALSGAGSDTRARQMNGPFHIERVTSFLSTRICLWFRCRMGRRLLYFGAKRFPSLLSFRSTS